MTHKRLFREGIEDVYWLLPRGWRSWWPWKPPPQVVRFEVYDADVKWLRTSEGGWYRSEWPGDTVGDLHDRQPGDAIVLVKLGREVIAVFWLDREPDEAVEALVG